MAGSRVVGIAVVLFCCVSPSASSALSASAGDGPAAPEAAVAALAGAVDAYRGGGTMAERLDYTVFFPDGRSESKAIEYGRWDGRRFLVMLGPDGSRIFHVTAGEGRLRALQMNAGSAYLEAPFEDSFVDAVRWAGGDQVGVAVPPGLAAMEADEKSFVASFGFGVLSGLRATGVETAEHEIEVTLEAVGGEVTVRLDGESGLPRSIGLVLGEGAGAVRLEGEIAVIEAPATDDRWTVDSAGRRAVTTFAELEASAFPLGQPAPALAARSLAGEEVTLASLAGRVVILDFWATWCVPCWKGLENVERLAEWARSSGLPVTVWTVDTLEAPATFEEQAALASGFLADRGLSVPVLVDFDDAFFQGMHSPGLPSTVVIAGDGTLTHYHPGVSETMVEDLRAQVEALLAGAER